MPLLLTGMQGHGWGRGRWRPCPGSWAPSSAARFLTDVHRRLLALWMDQVSSAEKKLALKDKRPSAAGPSGPREERTSPSTPSLRRAVSTPARSALRREGGAVGSALWSAPSLCYLWVRKGLGSDGPLKRGQHPRLLQTAAVWPNLPSTARPSPALKPTGAQICGEGPALVPGAVRTEKQLYRGEESRWATWKPTTNCVKGTFSALTHCSAVNPRAAGSAARGPPPGRAAPSPGHSCSPAFLALREPSRWMTMSAPFIIRRLWPDRMLPSKSGLGSASTSGWGAVVGALLLQADRAGPAVTAPPALVPPVQAGTPRAGTRPAPQQLPLKDSRGRDSRV